MNNSLNKLEEKFGQMAVEFQKLLPEFRYERSNFESLNAFVNIFLKSMKQYNLTTQQFNVLSFINFKSKYDKNITITSISKSRRMGFTTVQRCIEKLSDGYEYKRNGKKYIIDGCRFVKNKKPDGKREGNISITGKGRNFLNKISDAISEYDRELEKNNKKIYDRFEQIYEETMFLLNDEQKKQEKKK